MMYQKERPSKFSEVIGQDAVVNNIQNQSKKNTWFQVYILGGQFGSGKTTMARIIALASNCQHKDSEGNPCLLCDHCQAVLNGSIDFREIDGASTTGVDNIRELKEYISYRPSQLNKKTIIIDEVHMLSNSAFNSLLKMLEEPPEYAIFILCTTDVDAIPHTVQSRSACYSFGAIEEQKISDYLILVAKKNKIDLTSDGAAIIAKNSSGAMRNALKLLEQLSASGQQITEKLCSEVLGIANEDIVFSILNALMDGDIKEIITLSESVSAAGKDFAILSKDLISACIDSTVANCTGITDVNGTTIYKNKVLELSEKASISILCHMSDSLVALYKATKIEPTKNQFIIQAISLVQAIKECPESLFKKITELEKRIVELEQKKFIPNLEDTKVLSSVANNSCRNADITVTTENLKPEFVQEIPKNNKKETPKSNPIKMEIDEDSFFDSLFDNFLGETYQSSSKIIQEDKLETNIIDDLDKSEMAIQAEQELEKLLIDEPDIAVHVNVGCVRKYEEDGLILITPEKKVCNLLMLFLGRAGIKSIKVIYKEMCEV